MRNKKTVLVLVLIMVIGINAYAQQQHDGFFMVLRTLAAIMGGYESMPTEDRREQYDIMLHAVIQNSQFNFVRIFTVWKPNALDGMDVSYIGRVGSSPTGQYAMTYGRDTGQIIYSTYLNVGATTAYLNGPNARQERVEHVSYKVNGQDTYIIRMAVPIINPRTNEVVGTVGCYLDIRSGG